MIRSQPPRAPVAIVAAGLALFAAAGARGESIEVAGSWRWRTDAADEGRRAGWAAPGFDDGGWLVASGAAGAVTSATSPAATGACVWYRTTLLIPRAWQGKDTYCAVETFGTGEWDLFVNGTEARRCREKNEYARRSLATDVTALVQPGQAAVLAVRMRPDRGSPAGLLRVAIANEPRLMTWEMLRLEITDNVRFRTDPEHRGFSGGWHRPAADVASWVVCRLDKNGWDNRPDLKDYRGEAWYRAVFKVPASWAGERVFLKVPQVDGSLALYLDGRLLWARGYDHPREMPRMPAESPGDGDGKCIDLGGVIHRESENVLVVRVTCDGKDRGLRGPLLLAADPRALVFRNEWKSVTELAGSDPHLILPGWATGRGSTHTITGTIGGESECLVAPDGSFSPSNRSYSLSVRVYDKAARTLHAGERIPLADLKWQLESERCPFPTSRWQAGPVMVDTAVFAGSASLDNAPRDLVFYRCILANHGERDADLRVFVTIVPFSITREYYAFSRGYHPVRRIAYHPEWSAAAVNGALGVVSLQRPSAFGCTSLVAGRSIDEYAASGELPDALAVDDWEGLASGAFAFDVSLPRGKSEELRFVMPVPPMPATPAGARSLAEQDWKRSSTAARDAWKRVFDRAVKLNLPDADVQEAFYASLAYMLVLQDGEALVPGSFAYNAFWTRDAAYMIDACLRAGLTDTARRAAELWMGFQKTSGEFPSMGKGGPPEWDGQGQVLYSLVQVYRHTRDRKWLADHFAAIRSGARFIDTIRKQGLVDRNRGTPCWGILTPSVSAEDLGPRDWHFYWDDFWCIRGLQDAAFAARELDRPQEAVEIDDALAKLRASTLESILQVMSRDHIDWIPVAPENTTASGKARGTTSAVWPGGLLALDEPLLRRSFDRYWDELIAPRNGGYYHAGQPWPYATLELAHAYLNLGRGDRAYTMLRWALDNQSAPGVYGWAEVADSRTRLFLGGDLPHGWACAEYISLVRDMLVREDGDALEVGSGIPAAWLRHGNRIEIDRARTEFGTVGYRLTSRAAAGEIVLELSGEARPPAGLRWIVPELDSPVVQASIDGEPVPFPPDRRLALPVGAKRAVLSLRTSLPDPRRDPYLARMQSWRSGMSPANVYASVDDERPLLGVYFYFEGADSRTNRERIDAVREAFDFVQIGPTAANVRRCEQAGIPWMGVEQPAIPLGRDSEQWNSALAVIRNRTQEFADSCYLLGWNSGSEPHTSFKTPGYTGHSQRIYDDLGVAPPTRGEFLEWLAAEYADAAPGDDTNRDRITFNRDFGTGFGSWDEIARPANRRTTWFEHLLVPFSCKLIRDAEAGRLRAFRENDPRHKVTPRLLRSLADPRMSYDLTYLDLGDAAGVTFYCGGGFDMDDPNRTGTRVETTGLSHDNAFRFGIRMTPPDGDHAGIAQSAYRVFIPRQGAATFRCQVSGENGYAGRGRVEVVDQAEEGDAAGRMLADFAVPGKFVPVCVDLSGFAGRRIWVRLVSEPGSGNTAASRPASSPPGRAAPRTLWLEPRIEAGGRVVNDLVDFYKEARAGYRLRDSGGGLGPLVRLGLRGSMYQVWYADHVMSLIANRARLAGKRAVANEFHPGSGSPSAMFPMAVYDSMIRLMQFRCPSIAYFCHMYQGEFASYSMANSQEHVARARNQAILWNAYPGIPERRRSKVACFMPSCFATPAQATEAAHRFGTQSTLVWALGELGADFYLLDDLEQARDYDRVVIFLAGASREAEARLHAQLRGGLAGKRALVLTSVSTLWGPIGRRVSSRLDADLAEVLPVSPAGTRMVEKAATLLPGLRAVMSIADHVDTRAVPGFTPIPADDGSIVGARGDNILVLAGYPDTPVEDRLARGWFDTAMRRLIHRWLDVEPGLIDMGAIRIVTRDGRIDAPAIWCVENSSLLEVPPDLAGYDVLHQNPVRGLFCGPAVVRTWPAREPRLIDTDVCEPMQVTESAEGITSQLMVPASLASSRPRALTFYWPGTSVEVRVDGRTAAATALGAGFYRIDAPSPGMHEFAVRPAGATTKGKA